MDKSSKSKSSNWPISSASLDANATLVHAIRSAKRTNKLIILL